MLDRLLWYKIIYASAFPKVRYMDTYLLFIIIYIQSRERLDVGRLHRFNRRQKCGHVVCTLKVRRLPTLVQFIIHSKSCAQQSTTNHQPRPSSQPCCCPPTSDQTSYKVKSLLFFSIRIFPSPFLSFTLSQHNTLLILPQIVHFNTLSNHSGQTNNLWSI